MPCQFSAEQANQAIKHEENGTGRIMLVIKLHV
jgi:hypothetical protein